MRRHVSATEVCELVQQHRLTTLFAPTLRIAGEHDDGAEYATPERDLGMPAREEANRSIDPQPRTRPIQQPVPSSSTEPNAAPRHVRHGDDTDSQPAEHDEHSRDPEDREHTAHAGQLEAHRLGSG
jgi:hypothetical protein